MGRRAGAYSVLAAVAVMLLSASDVNESIEQIYYLGKDKYDFSRLLPHVILKKSYSEFVSGEQVVIAYWLEADAGLNLCNQKSMRVTWTWGGRFKDKPAVSGFQYELTPLEWKIFNTINFPKTFDNSVSAYHRLTMEAATYELSNTRIVDLERFLESGGVTNGQDRSRLIAVEEGRIIARFEAASPGKYNVMNVDYNSPHHNYAVEVHLSDVPLGEEGLSCALRTAAGFAADLQHTKMQ